MKNPEIKTDIEGNTWVWKNGCYWLVPKVQNRTKEELEALIKAEIKNIQYSLGFTAEHF